MAVSKPSLPLAIPSHVIRTTEGKSFNISSKTPSLNVHEGLRSLASWESLTVEIANSKLEYATLEAQQLAENKSKITTNREAIDPKKTIYHGTADSCLIEELTSKKSEGIATPTEQICGEYCHRGEISGGNDNTVHLNISFLGMGSKKKEMSVAVAASTIIANDVHLVASVSTNPTTVNLSEKTKAKVKLTDGEHKIKCTPIENSANNFTTSFSSSITQIENSGRDTSHARQIRVISSNTRYDAPFEHKAPDIINTAKALHAISISPDKCNCLVVGTQTEIIAIAATVELFSRAEEYQALSTDIEKKANFLCDIMLKTMSKTGCSSTAMNETQNILKLLHLSTKLIGEESKSTHNGAFDELLLSQRDNEVILNQSLAVKSRTDRDLEQLNKNISNERLKISAVQSQLHKASLKQIPDLLAILETSKTTLEKLLSDPIGLNEKNRQSIAKIIKEVEETQQQLQTRSRQIKQELLNLSCVKPMNDKKLTDANYTPTFMKFSGDSQRKVENLIFQMGLVFQPPRNIISDQAIELNIRLTALKEYAHNDPKVATYIAENLPVIADVDPPNHDNINNPAHSPDLDIANKRVNQYLILLNQIQDNDEYAELAFESTYQDLVGLAQAPPPVYQTLAQATSTYQSLNEVTPNQINPQQQEDLMNSLREAIRNRQLDT